MSKRDKYLFVRLLEACNAGCFMCGFANSTDAFRFGLPEFQYLIPRAVSAEVKYIRFTGGEPLMHREILPMVRHGADAGMLISLITNGHLLPRWAGGLADSGLAQVIVSIDGSNAESHNASRNLRKCFENAVEGIRRIGELGVMVRVNTVVGPHNYQEMPDLKRLLTDLGVVQWELSALKLSEMPHYDNPAKVMTIGDTIYSGEGLVPMGKRWYGDTQEERRRYFELGVPPRVSGNICYAATDVIYLDAKNSMIFPCSCLPHRRGNGYGAEFAFTEQDVPLVSKNFAELQQLFAEQGPRTCTGCSATAAGYSEVVESETDMPAWVY